MLDIMMWESEQELLMSEVARVPLHGHIVEWGSGGSTVHISTYKDPTILFESVEHNKAWHTKVMDELTDELTVYYYVEPTGEFTAFARIEEEDPTLLSEYISLPITISNVDLFLVDGVARTSILQRIAREGKVGCRVLLHDAERTGWYADGTKLFKLENTIQRLAVLIKE